MSIVILPSNCTMAASVQIPDTIKSVKDGLKSAFKDILSPEEEVNNVNNDNNDKLNHSSGTIGLYDDQVSILKNEFGFDNENENKIEKENSLLTNGNSMQYGIVFM